MSVALAALAFLAPACDQVDEVVGTAQQAVENATEAVSETAGLVQFCTAAAQVAQAAEDEDVDAAVRHGESLVEHAPDEVASQARTLLDAAKKAQGGDWSALQSQEFEDAAQAVAAHAKEHCDPR